MVHTFQNLRAGLQLRVPAVAAARAVDAAFMLSWVPNQGLDPILRGELDGHIRAYARDLAALDHPVLLRFGHEMNLPSATWSDAPERFIAAWRRVRDACDEAGATNVIWVWCPYVHDRGMRRFEPYYPGHDAVDAVGLDGYNWGRHRWWQRYRGFNAIFGGSYATLRELAPGKPIIVPEIGCAEAGGDKAAWMRETLLRAIPERFPDIEAVIWFNHHRPDHTDWRVDSSPRALAAWREIQADRRYQLSGDELLKRLSRGLRKMSKSGTAGRRLNVGG